MNGDIELFVFDSHEVRTMVINDEPYFVGKDVASILGYARPQKAIKDLVDLEDQETLFYKACPNLGLWSNNDFSDKTVINESGLYSLIMSSQLPTAKRFKHWVTSEVLPSIRQHGSYLTDETAFNITHNREALANLLQEAADQLNEKDAIIHKQKPKVEYYDSQMRNPGLMTTTEIAKDYGWSARRLNKELHERGVIFKQGKHWVPYQKYCSQGYTQYEPFAFEKDSGQQGMHNNLKWTQKGRKFIYDLLKADNIYPTIEELV